METKRYLSLFISLFDIPFFGITLDIPNDLRPLVIRHYVICKKY